MNNLSPASHPVETRCESMVAADSQPASTREGDANVWQARRVASGTDLPHGHGAEGVTIPDLPQAGHSTCVEQHVSWSRGDKRHRIRLPAYGADQSRKLLN